MTQADLISPVRFLARLPQHLPRVPRMLQGLYYAGIRNRERQLSLAWALERATRLFPDSPALMDESRRLSYPSSTPGPTAWPGPSRPTACAMAMWSR